MYIILQIGSGSYIYIIYIDCGCLNISIYIKKKMNITISGINISSYMKNAWLTFYDASICYSLLLWWTRIYCGDSTSNIYTYMFIHLVIIQWYKHCYIKNIEVWYIYTILIVFDLRLRVLDTWQCNHYLISLQRT